MLKCGQSAAKSMPKGVYEHKKGYKRPPFSKKWKDKIAEARKKQTEPRFKGETVGYHGLHRWLDRILGRPYLCQACGTQDQTKRYEWANISGSYVRDINDFIRLCKKCHVDFDKDGHTNHEIMSEKRLPEKLRDVQRL